MLAKLRIGDIGILLSARCGSPAPHVGQGYSAFLSQDGPVDIELHVECGIPSEAVAGALSYQVGALWQVHRIGNDHAFVFRSPQQVARGRESALRLLWLDERYAQGTIYIGEGDGAGDGQPVSILGHPLGEVLTIALLSRARGVELHAVGLEDSGNGNLFCGMSGAGKSTMANIWAREPGVQVLGDDRIIIRGQKQHFRIYGTPWHGEAQFASPNSAPLERLFFLRQGPGNSIRELSRMEAVARLMTCCFATFWDPEGMAFTLSFLEEMATSLPCYELTFVKDRSVVDFVRSL